MSGSMDVSYAALTAVRLQGFILYKIGGKENVLSYSPAETIPASSNLALTFECVLKWRRKEVTLKFKGKEEGKYRIFAGVQVGIRRLRILTTTAALNQFERSFGLDNYADFEELFLPLLLRYWDYAAAPGKKIKFKHYLGHKEQPDETTLMAEDEAPKEAKLYQEFTSEALNPALCEQMDERHATDATLDRQPAPNMTATSVELGVEQPLSAAACQQISSAVSDLTESVAAVISDVKVLKQEVESLPNVIVAAMKIMLNEKTAELKEAVGNSLATTLGELGELREVIADGNVPAAAQEDQTGQEDEQQQEQQQQQQSGTPPIAEHVYGDDGADSADAADDAAAMDEAEFGTANEDEGESIPEVADATAAATATATETATETATVSPSSCSGRRRSTRVRKTPLKRAAAASPTPTPAKSPRKTKAQSGGKKADESSQDTASESEIAPPNDAKAKSVELTKAQIRNRAREAALGPHPTNLNVKENPCVGREHEPFAIPARNVQDLQELGKNKKKRDYVLSLVRLEAHKHASNDIFAMLLGRYTPLAEKLSFDQSSSGANNDNVFPPVLMHEIILVLQYVFGGGYGRWVKNCRDWNYGQRRNYRKAHYLSLACKSASHRAHFREIHEKIKTNKKDNAQQRKYKREFKLTYPEDFDINEIYQVGLPPTPGIPYNCPAMTQEQINHLLKTHADNDYPDPDSSEDELDRAFVEEKDTSRGEESASEGSATIDEPAASEEVAADAGGERAAEEEEAVEAEGEEGGAAEEEEARATEEEEAGAAEEEGGAGEEEEAGATEEEAAGAAEEQEGGAAEEEEAGATEEEAAGAAEEEEGGAAEEAGADERDEAVAAEGEEAVAAEGEEAVAAEGEEAVAAEGEEAVAAEGEGAVAAEGEEKNRGTKSEAKYPDAEHRAAVQATIESMVRKVTEEKKLDKGSDDEEE